MKLSNFEAYIVVDGKELPEYKFEYDERTKTASCWVPSQAGKHFSVCGMPVGGYDANVVAKVFADGNYIDGFIFRQGMERHLVTWSGVRISVTSTKPLIFDLTDFTDDDSLLNCTNTQELGDITLHVFYAEIMTRLDGYRRSEGVAGFTNKVHEQTKKAIAHKVKLGQEIENPIENLYQVRFLSPICRLVFRYRSIDVLRADGIMPPATSQPEGKRKALEDDSEESEESQKKSMRSYDDACRVNSLFRIDFGQYRNSWLTTSVDGSPILFVHSDGRKLTRTFLEAKRTKTTSALPRGVKGE